MQDFRDLKVWEKGHRLTLAVYKTTRDFPDEERYGLTRQLRRASVSIPTNIAEGCGKSSDTDFARFLQIAMGSASEVDYLVLLVHDLGFLRTDVTETLSADVAEVKRMLTGLILKLKADS